MSAPGDSISRSPAASLPARLRRHATSLIRLAVPVMVARAGLLVMAAVDTAMVGHYSAAQLAAFGLASSPSGVLVTTGVGLLTGTIVMTAQALGAARHLECGAVWRRSLPYALAIGLIFLVVSQAGVDFLRLTGESPALAEEGGRIIAILGFGVPGAMLFTTTALFLEGIKRPLPGMIVMIGANVMNLALDWILVWGRFGLPAMGAAGSAWSTTIVRWAMALVLVVYAVTMRDGPAWGVPGRIRGWLRDGVAQRRVGYAAGLSICLESSAFAALTLFAGYLGARAIGVYAIGLNLLSIPFMAALGIGVATAVTVGFAHGRGDHGDTVLAGWVGLGATALTLAPVCIVYWLVPAAIAGLYTGSAVLIAVAAPLIAFSALILIADGGQAVMASALRGRGDSWVPTALHLMSYYGVMVPVSAWLAFGLHHGVAGLFQGILVASVVSVSVLSVRFFILSRRR